MNCVQARDQMPEYLCYPATGRRAKALSRHLEQCEGCREEWEFEKLLADTLRDPLQLNPPAHFVTGLRDQLKAEEPAKRDGTSRRLLVTLPHVAAAALFLLGLWAEILGPRLFFPTAATSLQQLFNPFPSLVRQMTVLQVTYWGDWAEVMVQVLKQMAHPNPSFALVLLILGLASIPASYFLLHKDTS